VSTSHPNRGTDRTIDLTDDERALLEHVAKFHAYGLGELHAHTGSAAELEQALDHAQLSLTLLRAAESGQLEGDERLELLLRGQRSEMLADLTYEQEGLERIRRGDPDYVYAGMTVGESETICRNYIDHELDHIAACSSLIDRMAA
jgi:hypothetical protein